MSRLQQDYHVVVLNQSWVILMSLNSPTSCDADGMIGAGRLLNESNLAPAQKLKIISSVTVGYDNYDVAYLNQKKNLVIKYTSCFN